MSQFNMRIEGLDKLIDSAHRAGGQLPMLIERAMVMSTNWVAEDAKRVGTGRFKNQTGNLRRSIFRRIENGGARGIVGVGSSAPYGIHVEFGTRPHTILPKKRRFLAFKSKSGKLVFARRVNHPGSRPLPFMEPALKDNVGRIMKAYERVGEEIIATLAS